MKVSTFLVEGFETVEALAVVDVLKRAGVEVLLVSVQNTEFVKSAQSITVKADMLWDDYKNSEYKDGSDLYFLPGGPGTHNYESNKELLDLIVAKCSENKRIAAICAGPTIFGHLNLLQGKNAICFPGCEGDLYGANIIAGARVVTDGNITTSRGMGTSIDLGLELVKLLVSAEKAEQLGISTQYK